MDELALILKEKITFGVSSRTALLETLKRSEGSGQVLQQIQADFRPVLIKEDEKGEEILSIEKVSKDTSPVIKLLDTLILNALHKRASDIHIEASETQVQMKYRIDGVLYRAMDPSILNSIRR